MDTPRPYNAVSDFVDRNVEQGAGDKLAFVEGKNTLTYGALQTATYKMANLLRSMGIKREARVAILMHDTVDWPVVYWGALRAGVVPVCLNTLLTADQYEYMFNDSRVEALFVSAALLPMIEPLIPQMDALQQVVVVDGDGQNYPNLQTLLEAADDTAVTADTCSDETAFWLYSSGSTGAPKGVRHVHSSPMYVAEHFGKQVLKLQPDDICFSAAKLFFAYGYGAAMAIPMAVGATTVLFAGRPTPQTVLEIMNTYNPTLFFGVPTLYAAMLADESCTPQNGSSRLRQCISAGEALPEDVGKNWAKRMNVDILDGIGSTEMLHVFLSNWPDDVKYGTSGKEIPGYKLRLVDENGNEAGVGEIGELLVSGGSAADGYWNQRAKSRATFAGEWTHTGDKYTRDAQGYYTYCGRTDDMFKVAGRWVSPFEVEQALVAHPSVLEAAVVAHEDDESLTKPKAFVVLNSGVSQEGLFDVLKDHVKESVGPWKYPRWIDFVDDLPKTATGKIQRFKLRV